jgi:prepilin-type N-terminal cleavage/methylation domain-containing protein
MAKRGFTLIELLVVIGIIAIITGVSMAGYWKFVARAQNVRCIELVHQTKTAIQTIYQKENAWPRLLLGTASGGNGMLDSRAAGALAKSGVMALSCKKTERSEGGYDYVLIGHDRFGVVTPWAMDYITRHSNVDSGSTIPTGGKLQDHIIRFAIDLDYDGITETAFGYGGNPARVRALTCVWSYGKDGKPGTEDDIRSWAKGQEVD